MKNILIILGDAPAAALHSWQESLSKAPPMPDTKMRVGRKTMWPEG